MKSKWQLFSSVFQLVVGVMAIAAFVILGLGGEDMTRWIITLLLAIAFAVMGIIGILDYKSQK
ncbi:MAG: hypothetical protein J6D20_00750 [Clostridia bacterium]|nr:hypothetical protein [Clostridia bacterium]